MTISKASSQLINRQSGLGCSTSHVGRRANPAVQKSHLASVECGNCTAGRVLQPIRKRYAEMTGTNHPKLYCKLTAQCTERCLISNYQGAPKRTSGKLRCNNFCRFPIMKKSDRNAVVPLKRPKHQQSVFRSSPSKLCCGNLSVSDDSPFSAKKWPLAGRNSTTVLFAHLPTEEPSG